MRIDGDFRTLAAIFAGGLGACLALAACGTTAVPSADGARQVATRSLRHGSAGTDASAAAHSAVSSPASTPSATPSAAPAAPASTGRYGNADGGATVPAAGRPVGTAHPARVIGNGTPASCTSAAVVRAVARGGIITFSCGPEPVTITMTTTAKVVNTHRRTILDGGGLVTLSGGGKHRILYMNACDPKQKITTDDCWEQKWPQLVVQNLTFRDAYSPTRETKTSDYGGGAIFAEGGQLKVVNSGFFGNRCYRSGPDLGGAAIRTLGMHMSTPVYIVDDTFRANACSNGGALSGLFANFAVYNSVFTGNKAVGWGANPASSGTAGGGSGGAIYTDGDSYNLVIAGTIMRDNSAREGGGVVFYVVDAGAGTLTIEAHSTLRDNPSGEFQNAPGIFDSVDQKAVPPVVTGGSTVS